MSGSLDKMINLCYSIRTEVTNPKPTAAKGARKIQTTMQSVKLFTLAMIATLFCSAMTAVAMAQEPGQTGAKAEVKQEYVYVVHGLDETFTDYNAMIRAVDKAKIRTLYVTKVRVTK